MLHHAIMYMHTAHTINMVKYIWISFCNASDLCFHFKFTISAKPHHFNTFKTALISKFAYPYPSTAIQQYPHINLDPNEKKVSLYTLTHSAGHHNQRLNEKKATNNTNKICFSFIILYDRTLYIWRQIAWLAFGRVRFFPCIFFFFLNLFHLPFRSLF